MSIFESSTMRRPEPPTTLDGFARILGLLARHHGIDSRDYKQGTLQRRTARRMGLLGFSAWSDYAAYLERHPEELVALYQDVLVRVTRFFRDPAQWEHLAREVVPRLLRDRPDDRKPIRVWSAGCATGEEAFGLVMIILEQLEHDGSSTPLQVFATDVSQDAVAIARSGIYPRAIARDVSPARLARFFTEHGDGYRVTREVRERVTVGYHDLLSDPPFSWLDLVVCRNLLIYLEPHGQQECLRRFHFSLLPHGVLWLGNAEVVDPEDELFHKLASEHHTYRRVESHRRGLLPWSVRTLAASTPASPPAELARRSARAIEHFVLSQRIPACVVVDRDGRMVRFFGPTSQYLLHPQGELRTELLAWVGPGLYTELRPALDRALGGTEVVVVEGGHVERGELVVPVTCTIEPIPAVEERLWLVMFRDLPSAASPTASGGAETPTVDGTLVQRLGQELQASKAELRRALEELAGLEADQRTAHEELMSINEELQVSHDALASSCAEALSVNEELQNVNRELERRNARLHAASADLENLLALTTSPTLFLDRRLCLRRFAAAAPGVMRLTSDDVGRPLEHIASRIVGERLLEGASQVLEQLAPLEATVRGDDGRHHLRRIVPYRSDGRVDGVSITFIEASGHGSAAGAPSRLLHMIIDHSRQVVAASEALRRMLGLAWRDRGGVPLSELSGGQWSSPALHALIDRALDEHAQASALELPLVIEGLGPQLWRLRASPLASPGAKPLVLVWIEDVTWTGAAPDPAEPAVAAPEPTPRRGEPS